MSAEARKPCADPVVKTKPRVRVRGFENARLGFCRTAEMLTLRPDFFSIPLGKLLQGRARGF